MSELGDYFKDLRDHRRDQRDARRSAEWEVFQRIATAGYVVVKMTEYHYRINGRLDLYPTNRRFHDLKDGERGSYRDALLIVKGILGDAK